MDILAFIYIPILIIAVILIIVTLVTLPIVGSERSKMIRTKAQSFAFSIIILMLIVEAGREMYSIFWGAEFYEGKPAFALLGSISAAYIISLLCLKRKHRNEQSD